MKTMLLIVERQKGDAPDVDATVWRGFLGIVEKAIPQTEDTKRILESVWQLPLELGLKTLPKLLQDAPRAHVRLAVHISEQPLDFSILP